MQTAERANNVPVVLDLFGRARDPEFVETQRYAREGLRRDHDPLGGLSGLPDDLHP